jgi:hypothetical protein
VTRENERAALELAARGWPVLPLKTDGSKTPFTKHGVHDASTDERTILHWFERWPDANVGVACGHPGPTVLDIDDPDQARDIIRRLGEVPRVATARGHHFYFQGADQGTTGLPYGELRGRGSYVVAPPSVHETGKVYTWVSSPNGTLPELPDFLVRQAERTGTAGSGEANPRETVPPGQMYAFLLDKAIRLARAGERDADVIERALVAAFELKRVPGTAYGGNARDTRRIAEHAAGSRIAKRERNLEASTSRFAAYTRAAVEDEKLTEGGHVTFASQVRAQRVEWLIPGLIPIGGVTLLAGDPKLGKSTLSCKYAAWLSRSGIVTLFASAEDSFARVIKPRLVATGADLTRVAKFEVIDSDGARNLDLPDDVPALTEQVHETGAGLVVIDPLNAHLTGSIDSWKDHGIRRALAPLARLADEHNCAVLVVAHLNKSKGGDPIYRVNGSIGNVGAARSVLGFGRNPDDPAGENGNERLVAHVASNWSALAATRVYAIETVSVEVDDDIIDTSRLAFLRESEQTAAEAFGARAVEDRGEDAEEAICAQLAGGARPSRDVKTAVMAELDISERTVKRAAQRLQDDRVLVVEQGGFPRTTTWALAVGPPPSGATPITVRGPTGANDDVEPNAVGSVPQSTRLGR